MVRYPDPLGAGLVRQDNGQLWNPLTWESNTSDDDSANETRYENSNKNRENEFLLLTPRKGLQKTIGVEVCGQEETKEKRERMTEPGLRVVGGTMSSGTTSGLPRDREGGQNRSDVGKVKSSSSHRAGREVEVECRGR